MIEILWDFVSSRGQHWLEWTDTSGQSRIKIVTEAEYQNILMQTEEESLDFLD